MFYPELYLIILVTEGDTFQWHTDQTTFLLLLLDQHPEALTCDAHGVRKQQ